MGSYTGRRQIHQAQVTSCQTSRERARNRWLADQVTSNSEKILDHSVHRPESLRLSHGFEPSHLSLTLSDRLMRNFSPIVGVAFGVVHDRRHDASKRCLIASQLVGHQSPAFPFLTFQ